MAELNEKIRFGVFVAIMAILLVGFDAIALEPDTYNLAGMDYVRNDDPNLTGRGVNVCVVERSESYDGYMPLYDYRPAVLHPIFENTEIITSIDMNLLPHPVSFHSTAVCSILAGSLNDAAKIDTGIDYSSPLKDSTIHLYEFLEFLIDYLLTDGARLDADVLSASFGTPLPDWWTDGMQHIIARDNIVGVASIGNGGEIFADCLYPAAGANFIAVGVADRQMMPLSDSLWLDDTAQSSYGSTADGRTKPDIVAPGNYLVADTDGVSFVASGNYSSFAAPAVAAVAGILVQKARDMGFTAAADKPGSNCVIKSILMNSAAKGVGWHKGDWDIKDDYTSPLDSKQGSGILDAAAAYDLLKAGQVQAGSGAQEGWDNAAVDGTSENTYYVEVDAGVSRYISATLVWNREFASSYPFEYQADKNVDLRLELWAVDAGDPNNDRLVDVSDSPFDNVEHIFCPVNPVVAKYKLVVVFSDREDAAKTAMSQQYGLAFAAVQMPKQWVGNWLDLNADGDITMDDLKSMIQMTTQDIQKSPAAFMTAEKLNGIRILLNEIAKKKVD